MKIQLKSALPLLVVACGAIFASTVYAQQDSYPSKSIRVIVPAPAGGPGDTIARILGKHITQNWKQSVVVENRPGANNIPANELVAKSPPDGHTLLLTVDYSFTVNPHTQKNLPYDPIKDFAHITTIANAVCVVVTSSAVPVDSMAALVKFAAAQPKGLTVGTGTLTTRLMTERLAALTKLTLVPVPYKGSAEAFTAIMGGHVDLAIAGFTPFREHVGKGKFNMLASTGSTRSAATPNTPTMEELGYTGFQTGVWMGMAAPAGTPAPIVKKLNDEINKILAYPEVIEQFNRMGLDPMPSNPVATVDLIRQESDRWGKVIRDKGIRLE